jgi:hypothetical protein
MREYKSLIVKASEWHCLRGLEPGFDGAQCRVSDRSSDDGDEDSPVFLVILGTTFNHVIGVDEPRLVGQIRRRHVLNAS